MVGSEFEPSVAGPSCHGMAWTMCAFSMFLSSSSQTGMEGGIFVPSPASVSYLTLPSPMCNFSPLSKKHACMAWLAGLSNITHIKGMACAPAWQATGEALWGGAGWRQAGGSGRGRKGAEGGRNRGKQAGSG